MNRRVFLTLGAGSAVSALSEPLEFSLGAESTSKISSAAAGKQKAQLSWSERLRLSRDRVVSGGPPTYTDEFVLADLKGAPARRFNNFSGDISGRYIGSLASVAGITDIPRTRLKSVVGSAIALQKGPGYFGRSFSKDSLGDNDMALLWGNGRMLVGLMEYYAIDPDPKVLESAKRLGDFLGDIAPVLESDATRQRFSQGHFASGYICWTTCIEGLVLLYDATHEKRYLQLAKSIVPGIELKPSEHVHGFLTSVRGALMLAHREHDDATLQLVEGFWDRVQESPDMLLTGGLPEAWSPHNVRTEGCAEADWLRLSLGLWEETGKVKYLEAAERTLFNEFSFNQFYNGDFGHRRLTARGFSADGSAQAWWCCTFHGLRAFADIHDAAFSSAKGVISYDLLVDGEALVPQDESKQARVVATTDFSQGASAILSVSGLKQQAVLRIRKPRWTSKVVATTRLPVKQKQAAEFVEIVLPPLDKTTIRLTYELADDAYPGVYSRGPWILGVDRSTDPTYFFEPHEENRTVEVKPLTPEGQARIGASKAFARTLLYHPGGFPYATEEAVLQPLADQTFRTPTEWWIVKR